MLKRSDGRWQDQITLPGMSKPKYFYGKTQKEVKQKMAQWRQEQAVSRKFQKVSEEWEVEHEKHSSYNTMRAYQAPLKRLREQFGDSKPEDITPDEVGAYLRYLAGRGYSQRTMSMEFAILNMIFDYSIVKGYTNTNPCGPVKLPSGLPKAKRDMPTEDQLEAVKKGVKEPFGLFPYMLLYTGMRRGELLALRWEDIDLKAGVIHVTKSVYFAGSASIVKEPKTESGKRTVVLLDALREVLPEPGKGFVFGGEKPLTDYQFRSAWRKWAAAAGLAEQVMRESKNRKTGKVRQWNEWEPVISPHQLRHAFATILYDAGVGEVDTMAIMGHSSIKVTREVYTHIRQERMEKTAEQINSFLRQEVSKGNAKSCQKIVKLA